MVTSRGMNGTKAGAHERRSAALNNFNRDATGATGTACDAAASSSERNGVGDRIGPPACVMFERVSVARSQVENGAENGDTIRTISQRAAILVSTRCLPRSKMDAIAGPVPARKLSSTFVVILRHPSPCEEGRGNRTTDNTTCSLSHLSEATRLLLS